MFKGLWMQGSLFIVRRMFWGFSIRVWNKTPEDIFIATIQSSDKLDKKAIVTGRCNLAVSWEVLVMFIWILLRRTIDSSSVKRPILWASHV